jgi:hypothetical protein
MAIGDQWHMFGTSSGVNIQPSSGVEVVLKVAATYGTATTSYLWAAHRTAANWHNGYAIAAGAYFGYGNGSQLKPSMMREYHGSTTTSESENVAIPINYTQYLYTQTTGTYGGVYIFSGYITKD